MLGQVLRRPRTRINSYSIDTSTTGLLNEKRVRETGMWLVSVDVAGEGDGHRIGYGPTSVINPQNEVVAQATRNRAKTIETHRRHAGGFLTEMAQAPGA
jgi:hypothetical protein